MAFQSCCFSWVSARKTLRHINPFKIVNVHIYKYELEEQLHRTANMEEKPHNGNGRWIIKKDMYIIHVPNGKFMPQLWGDALMATYSKHPVKQSSILTFIFGTYCNTV